jgi:hypothetical protein
MTETIKDDNCVPLQPLDYTNFYRNKLILAPMVSFQLIYLNTIKLNFSFAGSRQYASNEAFSFGAWC